MRKVLIIVLILLSAIIIYADGHNSLLNVYIDCSFCDLNYIKSEIPYINYVRDRFHADVIIMATSESIGRNGSKYYIDFIGQKDFKDIEDRLTIIISSFESDHNRREKITDMIRLGLVRFLIKTPLKESIKIQIEDYCIEEIKDIEDKWNNWVFQFYFKPDIRGEEKQKGLYLYTQINADKVTEDIKTGIMAWNNYREDEYEIEDEKHIYTSKSYGLQGHIIHSLNDNWSSRILAGGSSSTFNNHDKNFRLSAGLEYNIFPYEESSRRSFIIAYLLQYNHISYIEETIYDKEQESLLGQTLVSKLTLKQEWGNIAFRLLGSNYLHNFNKRRLEFSNTISLYMIEGLSISLANRFSMINDLLSLPKRDASPEDILLQRRQLETQYSYRFDITFRYIFGSRTSNIVNTRFDLS